MFPEISVGGEVLVALSGLLLLLPWKWVFGAGLAAAVHELGHILAIRAVGGRVHAVRLGLSGARIVTGPMTDRETLICALAGPAAGAAVMLLWRWLPSAAICALVQTGFNLLPLPGFDGWRAVRAAVGIWKEKAVRHL